VENEWALAGAQVFRDVEAGEVSVDDGYDNSGRAPQGFEEVLEGAAHFVKFFRTQVSYEVFVHGMVFQWRYQHCEQAETSHPSLNLQGVLSSPLATWQEGGSPPQS